MNKRMNTFKKILSIIFYICALITFLLFIEMSYGFIRELILCSGICPLGGVLLPWWEVFPGFLVFLVAATICFLIARKLKK